MKVIKRYSNRKLYDTTQSCYVTLDEIASMIREGEDIKIIDNKTGEDLTRVTLAQILFEEEKRDKKALPLNALRMIIQSPSDLISRLKSPMTDFREQTQSQVEKLRERAQAQQEEIVAPVRELVDSVQRNVDEMQHRVDDRVRSMVNALTPLSRLGDELQELRERVAYLEQRVDELSKQRN